MTTALPQFQIDFIHDRIDALDSLLSSEDKWTKTVGARTAKGKAINPADPQAVCWCLHGGIFKVVNMVIPTARKERDAMIDLILMRFRDALYAKCHHGVTLGEFNDDGDFDTVKALIAEVRQALPSRSHAAAGTDAAA